LPQSLIDGFNWAELLHDRNIKLDAWTLDVDAPDAESYASTLLASGVDQFTTNTLQALKALLEG
jgi:glycerophosphoryl diester phosphodiesterase